MRKGVPGISARATTGEHAGSRVRTTGCWFWSISIAFVRFCFGAREFDATVFRDSTVLAVSGATGVAAVLRSVGADVGVGVYPGRRSFLAVPWAIHSWAFGPL